MQANLNVGSYSYVSSSTQPLKVPYNAVFYLQALEYKQESIKEENLVDSYITDLASTIFGSNAIVSQLDQITARVEIVGEIIHEVLKDVHISVV